MNESTKPQTCYRKLRKYKYQLTKDYTIRIALKDHDVDTGFIRLTPSGDLTISARYAWDGPSGPTFDTKTFMRGSLVHDALYQLIRGNQLNSNDRKYADELLKEICLEDKMFKIRAWYVYWALRLFGGPAAKNEGDTYKKVFCTP